MHSSQRPTRQHVCMLERGEAIILGALSTAMLTTTAYSQLKTTAKPLSGNGSGQSAKYKTEKKTLLGETNIRPEVFLVVFLRGLH